MKGAGPREENEEEEGTHNKGEKTSKNQNLSEKKNHGLRNTTSDYYFFFSSPNSILFVPFSFPPFFFHEYK